MSVRELIKLLLDSCGNNLDAKVVFKIAGEDNEVPVSNVENQEDKIVLSE